MDDKIRVGDRVKFYRDNSEGVVMHTTLCPDGYSLTVQWDDYSPGHTMKFSSEQLIKLQPKPVNTANPFKVGQRVKLKGGTEEGTVTEADVRGGVCGVVVMLDDFPNVPYGFGAQDLVMLHDQQDIAEIEKNLIELIEEHGPNVWIRNKRSGETGVGMRIGDGLVKVWRHGEVNWPARLCEVVSQEAARMMGLHELNPRSAAEAIAAEHGGYIEHSDRDPSRTHCPPMDKERKLAFSALDRVKLIRKDGYRYVEVEGTVIESQFDVNDDGCERDRARVEWDRNYGIYWYAAEQLEKVHNEKDLNLGGREVKAISKKLVGKWTVEELNPEDFKLSDEAVEKITADARQQLKELTKHLKPKFEKGQKVRRCDLEPSAGIIGLIGKVTWSLWVKKTDEPCYIERVGVDWLGKGDTTSSHWADDLRHEPIKMSDIVSVQPMTAPTGHVFKMDFNLSDKAVEGRTAKDKGYKDGTTIPKSKRPPTYRRTLPGDGGTRGEY